MPDTDPAYVRSQQSNSWAVKSITQKIRAIQVIIVAMVVTGRSMPGSHIVLAFVQIRHMSLAGHGRSVLEQADIIQGVFISWTLLVTWLRRTSWPGKTFSGAFDGFQRWSGSKPLWSWRLLLSETISGSTDVQVVSFPDGGKARLDCVDFDLLLEGDLADVDLVANVRMTF